MVPEVNLSSNDARVLTAIFDPEAAPTSNLKIDITLCPLPGLSASEYAQWQKQEVDALRPLNVPQPSRADIATALHLLSDIINEEPLYTPAFANRAQTRRLLIGDDFQSEAQAGEIENLLQDLQQCISRTTPLRPSDPLSPQQVKLLAAAHTHRGYIFMKLASLAEASRLPSELKLAADGSKDALEEMASRDFFLGGRYGDRTARDMSVRTNPYAKMCGAIVKEAMRKEMEGA